MAQVAVSEASSCALRTDGTVWCWGDNSEGQLGDGTRTDRLAPVRAVGLSGVTQLSAGEYRWSFRVCAVRQGGTVWCWGDATGAMLTPTRVAGLTGAVQVTAGFGHECARLGTGSLRCWGKNGFGQLGDGTRTISAAPVAVTGLPGPVTQVDAGGEFTCARRSDGSVWCWGLNGYGQLGDGTTVTRPVPTRSTMANALAVTTGGVHTCALTAARRVKCWGGNWAGQLGNGTTTDRRGPVAVVGLSDVASVSAGASYSCAVLTEGTMRCWGLNDTAQLGNGTTQNSSFPTPVLR